ncbi:MAG: YitT family protein [Gluconobacter potus]
MDLIWRGGRGLPAGRLDFLDMTSPYGPGLRHSHAEDIYAFLIGCSLIVMGLMYLHKAGLVTGGVAGIALLLSYVVPMTPGNLFTVINIPFLLFAIRAMGARFAIKTTIASFGITALAGVIPNVMALSYVHPLFAAIFGGTVIGMGILSLARHQAGVGGTGVITLWLQKSRGINAGRVQIMIDTAILTLSTFFLPWEKVLLSAVSAFAMSGVLIVFHRPGRYIGH